MRRKKCKIDLDIMYMEWCVCVEGNPVSVFHGTFAECEAYVKENKFEIDNSLTWNQKGKRMIQTVKEFVYKANSIYLMFDAGAYWYETEDGKCFETLDDAKAHLDR